MVLKRLPEGNSSSGEGVGLLKAARVVNVLTIWERAMNEFGVMLRDFSALYRHSTAHWHYTIVSLLRGRGLHNKVAQTSCNTVSI